MNKSVLWKQVQMVLDNLSAIVTSIGNRITGAEKKITDIDKKVDAVPGMIPKLNLVNGKAEGSVRMVTAAEEEDGEYQLGEGAAAIGDGSKASGKYSYAEGQYSNAAGDYAHAEGAGTASGNWSHAEGGGEAVGSNSHAEGGETVAKGRYAHAEGYQNWADGKYSHVEGRRNCAKGDYSHAEGEGDTIGVNITGAANAKTYTIDFNSSIRVGMWVRYNDAFAKITAKPSNTSITVSNTLSSTAVSYGSATIYESIALGTGSHVEGCENYATGDYSHAEGLNTEASGAQAHTEGRETRAASENQHAQGKFNVEDASNKYAHIVGNGTSDTARSNAHTLDWNGNAWFKGKVFIGGNSMDDGAVELGAGGGGADWNANEGEPGYILNRPFGYSALCVVPETDISTSPEEEMDGLCIAALVPESEVSGGENIVVKFNGESYSYTLSGDMLAGNLGLAGGDDTGEPFLLVFDAGQIMVVTPSATTATLSVEKITIKKLDTEFVPDPDVVDLVGIGLPVAKTNERVSVEHTSDWSELQKKLSRGVVYLQFLFTGTAKDAMIDNTSSYENTLLEVASTVTERTRDGSGAVVQYEIIAHWKDKTFYFTISNTHVLAKAV